jgi:AbiV family abortive infection protein
MDEKERRSLAEIHRGARLIFENAEQLYNEAEILGTRGAFSRAVCLHQISLEECSKIDMLGAAATGLLMGHPVDLAKLARAMRKHEVKNKNFAYGTACTPAEKEAQEKGDHEEASRIFREQQNVIHDFLNTNKNASLYVDYVDGRFVAPSERITEKLAVSMQALNGERLAASENFLKLLDRMVSEPENLTSVVQAFLRHIESVPLAQVRDVIREWLNETKERLSR